MADIFAKYHQMIFKGIGYTMLVSIIGTIIGLVIGLLIGVFRTMPTPKNKFLRVLKKAADWILSAYVEIFRGTPMMVQAMVIFWGFALINNGVTLNVVFAGLFIVSINTGAYMAEIVRGGIISVSKGQFEGAHAIGMTHAQTMFYVVIPQVLRNILPSVANEFVINIKDTSVLNVIGFTELYFVAYTINSINYQTCKRHETCRLQRRKDRGANRHFPQRRIASAGKSIWHFASNSDGYVPRAYQRS